MSEEQDAKELEELVKQIEDYVDRGVWEPQPAEEIAAAIARADAVFNRIIEGYITMAGIPPVQQAYQVSDLQERLHRVQHNLPSPPPKQGDQGKLMVDKKVAIYTTPTWPWCHRAKEYLSRKGIAYIEHDVAQDKDKAREMIEKSGQMAVPVITIDDQVIVGFNQSQLDRLLS